MTKKTMTHPPPRLPPMGGAYWVEELGDREWPMAKGAVVTIAALRSRTARTCG